MRIACLQFAPRLGKVQENIARADVLLQHVLPQQCDLLVLPELAFSGYNFPSLAAIRPFLEPTAKGISSEWARNTASRLQCVVTVGYPEISDQWNGHLENAAICYNSTVTISPSGDILAHYRKTHLYYTDETWAQESGTKWLTTDLPLRLSLAISSTTGSHVCDYVSQTTRTSFGICMDLNPYQFKASWTLYELASAALKSHTQLLLISMAWLTLKSSTELSASSHDPDMETLSYWIERIVPLVNNKDREIIVVFANRCGEEPADARYAGSSWIGRAGFGKVRIWEIAGRAQETLLSIDTDDEPTYETIMSNNKVLS